MKHSIKLSAAALVVASLALQGCNDGDDDMAATPQAFTVEITNLTHHQPFAPTAVILHEAGYHSYQLGSMASDALEQLAESGDNSELLSMAQANEHVNDTASGQGLIAPGNSETIQMQGLGGDHRLSLSAMLVNSNDGFLGIDAAHLGELGVNDSLVLYAQAFDAGTEMNDEDAAHVPGQSGEGYNSERNDRDFIGVHPGVVGMEDGLTSSALDQSHRFDNPVAKIVVRRTQ